MSPEGLGMHREASGDAGPPAPSLWITAGDPTCHSWPIFPGETLRYHEASVHRVVGM